MSFEGINKCLAAKRIDAAFDGQESPRHLISVSKFEGASTKTSATTSAPGFRQSVFGTLW